MLIKNYQEVWEGRSSIRSRPRKIIDFNKTGYFFPETKQPLLLTKGIKELCLPLKEEILLQCFRKYLHDIVALEIKLVVSACSKILYKDIIVPFSEQQKLFIYTIMIDEYYHVYVAQDMLLQIDQQHQNIKYISYPQSDACNAVDKIKTCLAPEYRDIFEIIAICIFETTLVKELVEFFDSDNIHPCVKSYVKDHMNDESRHYGFFLNLLTYIWKHISSDYQDAIGIHIAHFIQLYLNINSDKIFYSSLLNQIIQNKNEANLIIDDLYKDFVISPEIPTVKNVLKVIEKAKLLDNSSVRKGFKNIGWEISLKVEKD